MAEDRIEKVIKPFQGETLERGFGNSNNLSSTHPSQSSNNQGNSGNNQSGNSNGNVKK